MDSSSDQTIPKTHKEKPKPSTTELFSSAKVVAGAAKASLNHEKHKLDKAKVADAAGDLIGAASYYGKLDQKQSLGKYVQKAENYLHSYKSSSTFSTTTSTTSQSTTTTHSAKSHSSGGSGGGGHFEGSGYGEYFKKAEGFLKKH